MDGDKMNNHISNLVWGTNAENSEDMARHGTLKGERNPASKLTEPDVIRLRKEAINKPLKVMCEENPQWSRFAVWAAVSGYTWSHVPGALVRGRTCSNQRRLNRARL